MNLNRKLHDKTYYLNNKDKIKLRHKIYSKKRYDYSTKFINKYKLLKGCESCGYNENPIALQFDHINRNLKLNRISCMRHANIIKIKNEIRKCRVLCANCHSIKSHEQKDYLSI